MCRARTLCVIGSFTGRRPRGDADLMAKPALVDELWAAERAAIASVLREWPPRHVLPQFLILRLLLPVIYAAISEGVFDRVHHPDRMGIDRFYRPCPVRSPRGPVGRVLGLLVRRIWGRRVREAVTANR